MIRRAVPRVAVVRLPGMNCEEETVRALASTGLSPELVGWDEPPSHLDGFDAYVLPGGFSYQDRVRAGAVAAKDPRVERIAHAAERGVPVLGICNGAQILVEAGLVPDESDDPAEEAPVEIALGVNHGPRRDGYISRWVELSARSGSLWTEAYADGERVPMPMAHGEGRFTSADPGRMTRLAARGLVVFAYASACPSPTGTVAWPDNPNGAEANAAGVTNQKGNVLALMPHPERADRLLHVPEDGAGPWPDRRRRARGDRDALEGPGPGHGVFLSLAWSLGVRTVTTMEVG